MSDPVCLFCMSFYIEDGESGYSEYSPGSPPRYGCKKRNFYTYIHDNDDFKEGGGPAPPLRSDMNRAASCPDYVYDSDWRTRS